MYDRAQITRITVHCLIAFFQHSDTAVIRNHDRAYDFTGDGTVDHQDVMALFEMV